MAPVNRARRAEDRLVRRELSAEGFAQDVPGDRALQEVLDIVPCAAAEDAAARTPSRTGRDVRNFMFVVLCNVQYCNFMMSLLARCKNTVDKDREKLDTKIKDERWCQDSESE